MSIGKYVKRINRRRFLLEIFVVCILCRMHRNPINVTYAYGD